jgi:hypothetical protein
MRKFVLAATALAIAILTIAPTRAGAVQRTPGSATATQRAEVPADEGGSDAEAGTKTDSGKSGATTSPSTSESEEDEDEDE